MSDGLPISIAMDPRTPAAFRRLAGQFPKEMYRAQGRAASIVARKVRSSVTKLGNQDIGKLPALSALRNLISPGVPGGVLGANAKTLCRVQKRGGTIYVGYVSGVEGVFARWQDGGSTAIPSSARAYLHRRAAYAGAPDIEIPDTATQPARPVIAPIAEVTRRDYPSWVESVATKLIAKSLARAGV